MQRGDRNSLALFLKSAAACTVASPADCGAAAQAAATSAVLLGNRAPKIERSAERVRLAHPYLQHPLPGLAALEG